MLDKAKLVSIFLFIFLSLSPFCCGYCIAFHCIGIFSFQLEAVVKVVCLADEILHVVVIIM